VYAAASHELFHERTLLEHFARYAGPVTIVWGRQDRYIPSGALAQARRVYPRADALLIERCGHCPHVEYPQLVAQRLLANGF
jgi:4,5:9,10-diseco-3-hydroxy-5,9,17-trioxoandrosta-1(10),2-diene-4-oate hydrolase